MADKEEPLLRRIQGNVVALGAIFFAVFTLIGVNGSLQALETRVRVLDEDVRKLNRVERQINTLQGDVKEIARLRNDILQAIEAATAQSARADRLGARADRADARRDRTP